MEITEQDGNVASFIAGFLRANLTSAQIADLYSQVFGTECRTNYAADELAHCLTIAQIEDCMMGIEAYSDPRAWCARA